MSFPQIRKCKISSCKQALISSTFHRGAQLVLKNSDTTFAAFATKIDFLLCVGFLPNFSCLFSGCLSHCLVFQDLLLLSLTSEVFFFTMSLNGHFQVSQPGKGNTPLQRAEEAEEVISPPTARLVWVSLTRAIVAHRRQISCRKFHPISR